jgi:hypothetical protein
MAVEVRDEVSAYHAHGTGQRVVVASIFLHRFGTLAGGSGCSTENLRAATGFTHPPQEGFPAGGLWCLVYRGCGRLC